MRYGVVVNTTFVTPAPPTKMPRTVTTTSPTFVDAASPMMPDSPTAARDTFAAARTHLANERTFLAWIRTAVSMFALGLGVALFYDKTDGMQHIEVLIAVGLSVTGIMTALLGYRRYRNVHDRVELGDDCSRVSRTVGLATVVAVAAGGLVLVFVATMAISGT